MPGTPFSPIFPIVFASKAGTSANPRTWLYAFAIATHSSAEILSARMLLL